MHHKKFTDHKKGMNQMMAMHKKKDTDQLTIMDK